MTTRESPVRRGSTGTPDSGTRCKQCRRFMRLRTGDLHVTCYSCRICSQIAQCETCGLWSESDWTAHREARDSHLRRSANRQKARAAALRSPPPPPPPPPGRPAPAELEMPVSTGSDPWVSVLDPVGAEKEREPSAEVSALTVSGLTRHHKTPYPEERGRTRSRSPSRGFRHPSHRERSRGRSRSRGRRDRSRSRSDRDRRSDQAPGRVAATEVAGLARGHVTTGPGLLGPGPARELPPPLETSHRPRIAYGR